MTQREMAIAGLAAVLMCLGAAALLLAAMVIGQ